MRFVASQTCFVEHAIRQPGDVVEVPDDFVPGPHLDPVKGDKAAEKAKAASHQERGHLLTPDDPGYFPQMIAAYSVDPTTLGRFGKGKPEAGQADLHTEG